MLCSTARPRRAAFLLRMFQLSWAHLKPCVAPIVSQRCDGPPKTRDIGSLIDRSLWLRQNRSQRRCRMAASVEPPRLSQSQIQPSRACIQTRAPQAERRGDRPPPKFRRDQLLPLLRHSGLPRFSTSLRCHSFCAQGCRLTVRTVMRVRGRRRLSLSHLVKARVRARIAPQLDVRYCSQDPAEEYCGGSQDVEWDVGREAQS